jgi:uncharacterized protein YjbI with pentapeptide repeats
MAKKSTTASATKPSPTESIMNRLAGKKIVFSGKFDWGEENSLGGLAAAQGGSVQDALDATTDYLVVADSSASKTDQKKALSLNGKGASIQVIDRGAFWAEFTPTAEEVAELIRTEDATRYGQAFPAVRVWRHGQPQVPKHTLTGLDFSGRNLSGFQFLDTAFEKCRFTGASLGGTRFLFAKECDFSGTTGEGMEFGEIAGSRFRDAKLSQLQFIGDLGGCDFSTAEFANAGFRAEWAYGMGRGSQPINRPRFGKSRLVESLWAGLNLVEADFQGADLTSAIFMNCRFESADFQKSTLVGASFFGNHLAGANFEGANLAEASFAEADLTGANFAGTNLSAVNFRGAKLDKANPEKGKKYDATTACSVATVGPALTELDTVTGKAGRIEFTLRVRSTPDTTTGEGDVVGVDSSGLQYGWPLRLSAATMRRFGARNVQAKTMSSAVVHLANVVGNRPIRYETVEVSTTKSAVKGQELRALVIRALEEAFGQPVPPEEELIAATKAWRDAKIEAGAEQREARKKAAEEAEKLKVKEKKQIAKKIEKAVGKVTDTASFLKALEVRIEKPKIVKATQMLKAAGFKLFNDVTDTHMSGVVKSQTDPDLVYACRIDDGGHYACCTQNLNICGGLRGSPCKHLLVLMIGLVQAGELDPTTIDGWLAKSHDTKPALDKDAMGEIFLKYKGAEAGEVDWRPTETVPEDYFAL